MSELTERLDLAIAVAREAGDYVMRLYQSPALSVERKADRTPVTDADRGAEELARARIEAACPGDAIVGEELPTREGSSGYRWYLDPIDGTQSFIHGVPLFGTMLGLEHGDEAVAGVIFMPALGEIVYAARSTGAWWATGVSRATALDARRAHVSQAPTLSQATVSATSARRFGHTEMDLAVARISGAAALSRGWGDCYGHCLVATGRIEVMVDPSLMSVWDCAPLLPILEEAGGRFTDVTGSATIHGGSAVSTNGLVHNEVLAAIRG